MIQPVITFRDARPGSEIDFPEREGTRCALICRWYTSSGVFERFRQRMRNSYISKKKTTLLKLIQTLASRFDSFA